MPESGAEKIFDKSVIADQVVDSPGKLDHIIHPATPFGTEFGKGPFVRQRLTVKIVIPGMPEIKIVLKKSICPMT
jgi:hypothetical protein